MFSLSAEPFGPTSRVLDISFYSIFNLPSRTASGAVSSTACSFYHIYLPLSTVFLRFFWEKTIFSTRIFKTAPVFVFYGYYTKQENAGTTTEPQISFLIRRKLSLSYPFLYCVAYLYLRRVSFIYYVAREEKIAQRAGLQGLQHGCKRGLDAYKAAQRAGLRIPVAPRAFYDFPFISFPFSLIRFYKRGKRPLAPDKTTGTSDTCFRTSARFPDRVPPFPSLLRSRAPRLLPSDTLRTRP